MHRWTHRDHDSKLKTCTGSNQAKIRALKGGSRDRQSPTPNKKLFAIDVCLEMKMSFFQWAVTRCQPHSRTGPCLEIVGQCKMNSMLSCGFFCFDIFLSYCFLVCLFFVSVFQRDRERTFKVGRMDLEEWGKRKHDQNMLYEKYLVKIILKSLKNTKLKVFL